MRLRQIKLLRWVYSWVIQILDPVRFFNGLNGLRRYWKDWHTYSRLPGAEVSRLTNTYPQLHDRTSTTPFDSHYFYVNGWAMRRIVANRPTRHVDIGSQIIFANLLSGVIPVTFLDYRPLNVRVNGLASIGGNVLQMPFADNSITSLSCLHVAEHIGLGRYGDPLDPHGTKKATCELTRVLAFEGNLYFAVPVGRPRLCFNAHRIHSAETIAGYFSDLELIEFSIVDDAGRFCESVNLANVSDSAYACGMFWFRKHNFNG